MDGILVAGNLIVDVLYSIAAYPRNSELTSITNGTLRSIGGAACNVIVALARLDPFMDLSSVGIMGDDAEADFIEQQLEQYENIDISRIKRKGKTSFTVVMSENKSNSRTLFHFRGANATLCEDDFDLDAVGAKIMHIGYILLLDTLDQPDREYGTKMARLLAGAQKRGIQTSIDVVSEMGGRFETVVPPALKYTDYCIINELEAQQITGIPLREEGGRLLEENVPAALEKMVSMGVRRWAVIHAPEGGFGIGPKDKLAQVKSLDLPSGFIKGTVGAGDAFCAGVLYGAYRGAPLATSIKMGIAAASCSLSKEGSVDGIPSAKEALKLYEKYAKNRS
jgi:sugar/nucleoside kinase (ribokinase family)